ncbi:putative C2 domain protein [Gregarina niphandrodes]|uniref:C2 domain protein n=1 Tax=Gregarina niphandrodes TaxID=110365 RepID=A0A023B856_GRENI|nr:putative C2 domain protein [Gregarina niphandrodes]EZG68163.1 putative C2 domain protein [Gregarina niphandrodes]|eukprot:XP_011130057.1 putative C2 domain protein [Gregarina niphandrodes]
METMAVDPFIERRELVEWSIAVTLHETKDLKCVGQTSTLPNQWHSIRLGTQETQTPVRQAAASTAYDQHSSFHLKATIHDLGCHLVEITSYHKFTLSSEVIGKCSICPRTIYERTGRSTIQFWQSLLNPEDPTMDVGKICISVSVKSDRDNVRLANQDGISSSSASIQSSQNYNLLINIYKGQDIATTRLLGQNISEPFIEVLHGINRAHTRVIPLNSNPDWNTQLSVPAQLPALDGYVRIGLYNGSKAPVLFGYHLISLETILSGSLNHKMMWIDYYWNQPTSELESQWMNMTTMATDAFQAVTMTQDSVCSNYDETPPQLVSPNSYVGRLLIQIAVRNVHKPSKVLTSSCGMAPLPETHSYELHGQIFEIASTVGNVGPLKVELAVGPIKSFSGLVSHTSEEGYRFRSEAGEGHLDPLHLMVTDMKDAWLAFIYLHSSTPSNLLEEFVSNAAGAIMPTPLLGGLLGAPGAAAGAGLLDSAANLFGGGGSGGATELQRIAYTYLTLQQITGYGSKPVWIPLKTLGTETSAFKILARFVLADTKAAEIPSGLPPSSVAGSIPSGTGPVRSAVPSAAPVYIDKAYNARKYIFRCFLYELANLKCTSSGQLPSPYVKIELGSDSWITREIIHSCNPQFYQSYENVVKLPDDITLANDISISVYNKASVRTSHSALPLNLQATGILGSGYSDELVGSTTFSISKVPKAWAEAPVWLSLSLEGEPAGRILCAFEILNIEEQDQYPYYDDVRPSTYECSVLLCVFGIVSSTPLFLPKVKVAYGRDVKESDNHLWSAFSSAPLNTVQGTSGGTASAGLCYEFNQNFQVDLHLPKRSFHFAYLEIYVYNDNQYNEPALLGILPLSQYIPWYTPVEREIAQELFAPVFYDDVARDGQGLGRSLGLDRDLGGLLHNARGHKSGEDDNALADDELRSHARPANARVCDSMLFVAPETAERVHIDPPGKIMDEEADFYVPKGIDGQALVRSYNVKSLMFNMRAKEETDLTDDERKERISGPLEDFMDMGQLPYQTVSLVQPSPGVFPVATGKIKFNVLITQHTAADQESAAGGGRPSANAVGRGSTGGRGSERLNEFHKKRKAGTDLHANNIEVRVYCLSVQDVKASTSVGLSTEFYLTLDFPGNASSEASVFDRSNARSGNLNPVFNKCYRFVVDLPSMGALRIRLMQTGTLQDEEVGGTVVNLQDRWWLPEYRHMVAANQVPIEARVLRRHESASAGLGQGLGQGLLGSTGRLHSVTGVLSCWVEMLTAAEAQSMPVAVLSSSEPQPHQLRVVVWQLKDCQMGNTSSVSLNVSCSFRHLDDSLEAQWTDTHYNSRDGSATFNWRMVFSIFIPARFSTVQFSIHHHSLIGVGDLLGTCTIDLQRDFALAQRRKDEYTIPRTWTKCYHPNEPDVVQGQLEYEIAVVSQNDATANPVGKGREEPNRNPYLDPVLENRDYVDWQGLGQSLQNIAASITWTTKWFLYIGGALLLLFTIVYLILAFK